MALDVETGSSKGKWQDKDRGKCLKVLKYSVNLMKMVRTTKDQGWGGIY